MIQDPYEAIKELGAAPLWKYYGNLFPAEPKSEAVPYVWRYRDLRPYMLHFSEVLSLHEAERRVLMLVNPGLTEPPATVNSLYAGIQIILPGETAQAHRHSASAFQNRKRPKEVSGKNTVGKRGRITVVSNHA
ncbi:hypothetical protein [Sulfobacillus thermotolerans]|uniref:hypothetical protein n=1 Tax=Sulfobacillus thermotolerans TaxID=338644 RepID=UPI0033670143